MYSFSLSYYFLPDPFADRLLYFDDQPFEKGAVTYLEKNVSVNYYIGQMSVYMFYTYICLRIYVLQDL